MEKNWQEKLQKDPYNQLAKYFEINCTCQCFEFHESDVSDDSDISDNENYKRQYERQRDCECECHVGITFYKLCDIMIDTINFDDRELMKDLMKGYIFKHNISPDDINHHNNNMEIKPRRPRIRGNKFDCRGCLVHTNSINDNKYKDPITIEHLRNIVREIPVTCNYLDFSRNYLYDGDLALLICYIKELLKDFTYAEIIVDISYNDFHAFYDKENINKLMLKLIRHPMIKYVNISQNLFASIDNKEFFKEADKEILSKLIWISASWFITGKHLWKHLIPTQEMHRVVIETHKKFYRL